MSSDHVQILADIVKQTHGRFWCYNWPLWIQSRHSWSFWISVCLLCVFSTLCTCPTPRPMTCCSNSRWCRALSGEGRPCGDHLPGLFTCCWGSPCNCGLGGSFLQLWRVESRATSTSSEHLSRHQLVPRLHTCLPKFQPQKDANCAHLLCLHLLDAGERSVKAWMHVMWFSISSNGLLTRLMSQGRCVG